MPNFRKFLGVVKAGQMLHTYIHTYIGYLIGPFPYGRSNKNPHEYYFCLLQLFQPFLSETELGTECEETCFRLVHQHKENIGIRRRLLFPHMDEVLDAVQSYEPAMSMNVNSLDPLNQQDNEDCRDKGIVDHPDFIGKDPSQVTVYVPDVENDTCPYPRINLLPEIDMRNLS